MAILTANDGVTSLTANDGITVLTYSIAANDEPLLCKFARYILDNAGVLPINGKVFAYYMPQNINVGVGLLNAVEYIQDIDYDYPTYEKGNFQLVVRHQNYLQGWRLCDAVVNIFTIHQNMRVYDVYINYVRPMTDIIVFPRTKSGSFEFLVEYEYCIVR